MTDLDRLARSWGVTAIPFSHLSDQDWLSTPSNQEALRLLDQTARVRGVMLLSGDNGLGKSVLAARWVRGLEPRLFTAVSLTQATLSGNGLLAALVTRLGKRGGIRRERHLDQISTFLDEHPQHTLVIVLDDAQNYSHATLEEVRLLLGLNLPTQPAFALILIGDDYLLGQLQLRNHRALYSRLSAHYALRPWTPAEVADYVQRGLRAVGLDRAVFTPPALDMLVRASAGVPRSVCLLARAAWLRAATTQAAQIGPDLVQQAIEQVPGAAGLQRAPDPA